MCHDGDAVLLLADVISHQMLPSLQHPKVPKPATVSCRARSLQMIFQKLSYRVPNRTCFVDLPPLSEDPPVHPLPKHLMC